MEAQVINHQEHQESRSSRTLADYDFLRATYDALLRSPLSNEAALDAAFAALDAAHARLKAAHELRQATRFRLN